MRKGFWTGFALALLVCILPLFLYMDARSSGRTVLSNPPAVPQAATTFSLPPEEPPPPKPLPVGTSDPVDNIVMVQRPEKRRLSEIRQADEEQPRAPIRTVVYDPSRLYTLKTALSHVTIVDLPEDAREVYVGDSKLFLAEVLGSRIKIKPITYDLKSRTNMIVYTEHDRLSFRLLVVPAGEEDDLLSFRLPKSETVVNLNPIKTVIRQKLKEEETRDLNRKSRELLKEGEPQQGVRATFYREKVMVRLLGFSSQNNKDYALIDCRNDSGKDLTLTQVRLRRFRKSLLWESTRNDEDGMDWSRDLNTTVPHGGRVRLLLRVEKTKKLGPREGFYLSGTAHFQGGQRFRIEAVTGEGGS